MQKNKLYIVDDNEAVCQSLKFLFDSFLLTEVKTYSNPVAFLAELAAEWRGCLLVDFFMPYIDGIELIGEIKKSNSHLQIFMMSGHGGTNVACQALAAGANAFFNKPFNTQELLQKIATVMEMDQSLPGYRIEVGIQSS